MEEKRKFYHSLVFPAFFLLLIWTIKITEVALELNFAYLGLFPLKMEGLKGILLSPMIHADFKHLFDNSVPLFFLSVAIFYFYRPVAYQSDTGFGATIDIGLTNYFARLKQLYFFEWYPDGAHLLINPP